MEYRAENNFRSILFNVYFNDLNKISNGGKIISYIEDTVIYYKFNTWEPLKQTFQ